MAYQTSDRTMYGGPVANTAGVGAPRPRPQPSPQPIAVSGHGSLAQQWMSNLLSDNANNNNQFSTSADLKPATGDDGMLMVTRILNVSTTSDELAKNPELRMVRSQVHSKIPADCKLIPLSSTVTHIKNTSSVDLAFKLTKTPINTACVLPDGYVQADIFLPAGTPLTQVNQSLFTCDPKKQSSLEKFNGWHKVTPENLESSVLFTKPDATGSIIGAFVRVPSPLYDMIKPSFEQLGLALDGPNANAQFHEFCGEHVIVLPDEIARSHIERGKALIRNLPFKNPSNLEAELMRADGKSFTDVASYVGNSFCQDSLQDMALKGSFQALVMINDIYRIWHE